MTGPPYFNDSYDTSPYYRYDSVANLPIRPYGSVTLLGEQFYGSKFYQLVPNGEIYPANDPSVVFENGTRYYGALFSEDNSTIQNYSVVVNTTYPNEINSGLMSLKPGVYNLHAQKNGGNIEDTANVKVEVVYGNISIAVAEKYQNIFTVSGRNTDSKVTYLWLTGEDLPECGTNLSYNYAKPKSGNPTIIGNETMVPLINEVPTDSFGNTYGSGHYYANGDFSFDWRIPPTLKPGNYTIYASSVNPSNIPGLNGSTWASTEGVCGLQCKICAPSANATFSVGTWSMGDPYIENGTITIDCTHQNLCTTCPTYPKVILKGQLNVKGTADGFPLQIWIFGDDKVGDQTIVYSDKFRTFPDDQSSYEIDITRLLLENGITVCDLENGDYYIVVQSKGLENGVLRPGFDIVHERMIAFNGKPVFDGTHWYVAATHPYSKFPIGYSSIISMGTITDKSINSGYYPLFAVEGPGSLSGLKALNALKTAFNQSFIHDQYRIVTFTVNNKLNRDGVDFTADPVSGEVPLKVTFTDTSAYSGTEYLWDFGDGSNSTSENPTHTYQRVGQYDVSLTVKNGTDYRTRNKYEYINVTKVDESVLKAAFTADQKVGTSPLTVQFIDQSTGNPVAWNWNFGDSSTSSVRSPQHTYRSTGSYTVQLQVYDRNENTDTLTEIGFIKVDSSSLRAAFRYGFPTQNFTTVQFTDLSEGTGINSWNWDFGDGSSSTLQNPLHKYSASGCYTVILTVANNVTSAIRSYQICI